jgi:Tfp pilus assembly protein PilF
MATFRCDPEREDGQRQEFSVRRMCSGAGWMALLWIVASCAATVDTRELHVVDGEIVASRTVSPLVYAAYLQTRLALESKPPRLDEASSHLDRALHFDPNDPQLWTTKAQIAELQGDEAGARTALARALALNPAYDPARQMMATLDAKGQKTASAPAPSASH